MRTIFPPRKCFQSPTPGGRIYARAGGGILCTCTWSGLVAGARTMSRQAGLPNRANDRQHVLPSEGMHTAQVVTAVVAGLTGLPAGSFATVLAERVPGAQSVLRPAGRCPLCGSALTAAQMIPVLSWLRQHGRCAACGQPYGSQYLAAEVVAPGVLAALGYRIGPSILLAPLCYLSVIGIALALIDIQHHRLPHALTLPSYLITGVLLVLAAPFTTHGWRHLVGSLAGMAALWLFYAALAFLFPGQMGWGDVWLGGLLGLPLAWFGLSACLLGTLAGLLLAWPVALRRIAARQRGKPAAPIALGPFMLAGALLTILAVGV
jgi:leader peptidase (prepilin peptidase) / N-methyltransferase